MAIFENFDGTHRSTITLGKTTHSQLRENGGDLEYRNHGLGAWIPVGTNIHNDLTGLDGGDPLAVPKEFYHLTEPIHTDLTGQTPPATVQDLTGLERSILHFHDNITDNKTGMGASPCSVQITPLVIGPPSLPEGVYATIPATHQFTIGDGVIGSTPFLSVYNNTGDVSIKENLKFRSEDDANFYTILSAGTLVADRTITFPTSAPAANDVLQSSDVNGNLVWTAFPTPVFELVGDLIKETAGGLYNNDFVIGSPILADETSGTYDKRLFFDESKGAFRVGIAQLTQWDDANVGLYSSVVGGLDNTAFAQSSAIIGGETNSVLNVGSTKSTILGGSACIIGAAAIAAPTSAIIGGTSNLIASLAASTSCAIVGGSTNKVDNSLYAGIFGGNTNTIGDATKTANNCVIIGGESNSINTITGTQGKSTIVGGDSNTVNCSTGAAIVGGSTNKIGNTGGLRGDYGFIGGGSANTISQAVFSDYCAIVGGGSNKIEKTTKAVIAGGDQNDIGTANFAANFGFIGGGNVNKIGQSITSTGAAMIGGANNSVNATYAVDLAGQNNTNIGASSVAMGERCASVHQGSLNIGGGYHDATNGTLQSTRAVVGISSCAGTVFQGLGLLDTAANYVTIAAGRAYGFEAYIVGQVHTGGTLGDSIYYKISGLIKRIAAGNATIVGVPVVTLIAGDVSLTGAGDLVTAIADAGNQALIIQAKSVDAATTTINWSATVDLTVVGYA